METEEQEMDKREPVVAFPRTPGIIGIDSYKKFAVLMPVCLLYTSNVTRSALYCAEAS